MKVRILAAFTGYPDDTIASETEYHAGAEETVSAGYGKLLIAKGHAEAVGKQAPDDASEDNQEIGS